MATKPIAYPLTYQRELAPAWLHYAAVLGGAAVRDPRRAFRYLELGCGGGFSSLIHAAANPQGEFHACDHDAEAIDGARARAEMCGVRNVTYHAAAFDDPLPRSLPRFDFIVMHGVYSWVDAETRAAILSLLKERLAPGGLVYVSYNALPGWVDEPPLRRLLREMCAHDDLPSAVRRIERLRASGFAYFTAHPAAERAVLSWSDQPAGYLAQEYLAAACEPLWPADVAEAMADAGLRFVGSATLRDQHEALLIDPAASRTIAELATPRLRAMAMDFAVNRAFRRDVFVRGDGDAPRTDLRDLVIGCAGDPCAIAETIVVPRERIRFDTAFIVALRSLMRGGAITLGDAVRELGDGHKDAEVARNLLWLVAAGELSPFLHRGSDAIDMRSMLCLVARGDAPGWIASPLSGGGVAIGRAEAIRFLDQAYCDANVRERLHRLGIFL